MKMQRRCCNGGQIKEEAQKGDAEKTERRTAGLIERPAIHKERLTSAF